MSRRPIAILTIVTCVTVGAAPVALVTATGRYGSMPGWADRSHGAFGTHDPTGLDALAGPVGQCPPSGAACRAF